MHRVAHPTTTRRRVLGRVVPAMLGVGLAVVLSGCGAGQITQTDTQQSGVNGASANAGPIALRDVQLAAADNPQGTYTPGSNATLVATIVNTGLTPDTLIKVTTPAATTVLINGTPSGSVRLPGNFAVSSGIDPDDATSVVPGTPAPSAPSSVPSSAPSSVAPTSGSAGPSASAAPGRQQLAPGRAVIQLSGLGTINGTALRAGMTIPVTFYFARAGQVTIDNVPVGAPADGTAVLNPAGTG